MLFFLINHIYLWAKNNNKKKHSITMTLFFRVSVIVDNEIFLRNIDQPISFTKKCIYM